MVICVRSECCCCGVLPPRLLQGHSPIGEPQCMALVGNSAGSCETLVNGSEPSHLRGLQRTHPVFCMWVQASMALWHSIPLVTHICPRV